MLTNTEKIEVIESHKRNLAYTKYNVELSLIEENARVKKNQTVIDSLQGQIAEIELQVAALDQEIANLS